MSARGFCPRCGFPFEPSDRFCGGCGAPLVEQPSGTPVAASRSKPRRAEVKRSGCGCGLFGCLGLLLLLGGGAIAGWILLSESEPEELVASALESIERLAGNIDRSGSPGDSEPAVGAEEPSALSARERAALAATARGSGPASERLSAAATMIQAGVSDEELSEIERLQARAQADLEEALSRESARRERFVKEAASGGWLRSTDAEEVWSSAGGR